ncbi:hypothetical protein ACS0TY_000054 [Phlomoides rotata]
MLWLCLLLLLGKRILREPLGTKKATVLPGTSREEYNATDLVDSDPAGFQEQFFPVDQGSSKPLLPKATVLPGTSREEYNGTDLVDSDPAGFQEQVSVLFADWYNICELPGANDAACARYALHLQQRGLLKGDETQFVFSARLWNSLSLTVYLLRR